MTIAQTILDQLGGNKFIAMTGAKNIVGTKDGVYMRIGKNKSKANHLFITLNGLDLYDMSFKAISMPKININTGKITGGKNEVVKQYGDLMFDQLEEFFSLATGMNTRL